MKKKKGKLATFGVVGLRKENHQEVWGGQFWSRGGELHLSGRLLVQKSHVVIS